MCIRDSKNRMTGRLAVKDSAVPVAYDERSKRVYNASGRCDFSYSWEKQAPSPESFDDLPF